MTEHLTAAEYQAESKRKRPKYGNRKTTVDGIRFDSKREALRWLVLKQREHDGEISRLDRQIPILLAVRGEPVCTLVVDFVYCEGKKRVFEDAKGFQTPESKLKMRLAAILNPDCDWRLS